MLLSFNLFGGPLVDKDWKLIANILQEPLWQNDRAYNASHYLMLPLYASFHLDNKNVQQLFSHHFELMLANRHELPTGLKGRLVRLQYLYFASEYLRLAGKQAPPELAIFLETEIEKFWLSETAWQWGHESFNGIKKRLIWKLEHPNIKPSYYKAIIDEEFYLMGVAANLHSYYRLQKIKKNLTQEIMKFTYQIFNEQGRRLPSGGYLFQEGVWAVHPDYQYAGNNVVHSNLRKKNVPTIAMDTSHSHRLPLWLLSFEKADVDHSEFYRQIRLGLAKQFFDKVIIAPTKKIPFYRTTNFFCGNNGVYRYLYNPKMNRDGYGPFALSGTLLIGWWIFLPDERVKNIYNNLSVNYNAFLKWASVVDPYEKNSWIYQDNYPLIIPLLLKIATHSLMRERLFSNE